MVCDANTLVSAAGCFACLTREQLAAVRIYLLCQWVNER